MEMVSSSSPPVRSTRQRAAIVALLDEVDGFRSAQELHDELRRRGTNIGLTTVYRTLQTLAGTDVVDTVRTDPASTLYRPSDVLQHGPLVVRRQCGSAVEVSGKHVEAWAAEVATRHGFSDVNHTIELFGTCADCA